MDFESALRRLEVAQGDPDALALATVDIALRSHDPSLRAALDAAVVPHWFDESSLRALLGNDTPTAPGWFAQLTGLAIVEKFHSHHAWNVHEVTRLALRDHLARERRDLFVSLGARAASLVTGDDGMATIERVYHLLSSSPERGAKELRQLWREWQRAGKKHFLQALERYLDELCSRKLLEPLPAAYALIALGEMREDRISLADWEKLAREALQIVTGLRDDVGFIDANKLLGKVLRENGHFVDSIAAFEKAVSRLTVLESTHPDLQELEDERASMHTELGRTLAERGQTAEALAHFEKAKGIREEHCAKATGEDQFLAQRELAVAYADVGDALLPLARTMEAESFFDKALGLLERQRTGEPANMDLLQNIGRVRIRLCDALHARGKTEDALQQLQAAQELIQSLLREEPDHFFWKADLAQIHLRWAAFSGAREFIDEDDHLGKVLETYSELAERDPTRTQWKQSIALARLRRADFMEAKGRLPEAAREHIQARELVAELAASDPGRASWQLSVADANQQMALFMGRLINALPDNENRVRWLTIMIVDATSARDAVRDLAGRDPGNVRRRRDLADAERVLASVMRTLANCIDAGLELELSEPLSSEALRMTALETYASSALITHELLAQLPEQVYLQSALVDSLMGAAGLLEKMGRHDDALKFRRRALAAAETLAALDPANKSWAHTLSSVRAAISRSETSETSSH